MKNKYQNTFKITNNLQKKFLLFSNDNNPIHIDKNYSKVFFDNQKVVYGVLTIIKSLSFLTKKEINKIKFLQVNFLKPIYLNQKVFIKIKKKKFEFIFLIFVNEDCKAKILARFKNQKIRKNFITKKIKFRKKDQFKIIKGLKKNYLIEIDKKLKNFPILNKTKLNKNFLNELGFLSYFIGTIFPGHGAIISSIEINIYDLEKKINLNNYFIKLNYFNKNLKSSIIDVRSDNQYKVTSFFLPKKKLELNNEYLNKVVYKNEFQKSKNLIIGGSGGIGLATAKILESGNGKTYLTYRDNLDDLKNQINFPTKLKKISFIKFDINTDSAYKKITKLNVDNIFYFPTPKIFLDKKDFFEKKYFENFNNFYIYKFFKICKLFEIKKKRINIFFPSTVAINNYQSLNLNEYIMSKLASEILIDNLNKKLKYVKIYIYKLPRIDTNQTSNIMGIKSLNPIKKMLPLIKNFLGQND